MAHDRYRRGGGSSVGGSYAGRGFGGGGGSNFGGGRAGDLSLGGSTASAEAAPKSRVTVTTGGPSRKPVASGDGEFKAGDKVAHGKWGTGTIVAVKGSGNDMELQIAFPAPVGVKRLLPVLHRLRRWNKRGSTPPFKSGYFDNNII